jgi:hypothetical protein
MEKKQQFIIEIIQEIKRIDQLSPEKISQEWIDAHGFPIPSMLSRGDGSGTIISPKVDRNIHEIRKLYSQKNGDQKREYAESDLLNLLRNIIGLSLANIDFNKDDEGNAEIILSNIDSELGLKKKSYDNREYFFGCTLFIEKGDQITFSIGPVRFEPRLDWLERKKEDGSVPEKTYSFTKETWNGERDGEGGDNDQEWDEKRICRAVNDAPFICSVMVNGLAPEMGKEKALEVARLALTVIALTWQTPSKALDGLNLVFDRKHHVKVFMYFSESKKMGFSINSQTRVHGFPLTYPHTWEEIMTHYRDIFDFCGQIFNYALSQSQNSNREALFNSLLHALIWFQAGCREVDKRIAVVNYAACLDALSSGGETSGIKKLIAKQLGISPDDSLFDRPAKKIVEEIYSNGRSRTIHGTNDRLGQDWTTTKTQAEILARLCLLNCINSAIQDVSITDAKSFI